MRQESANAIHEINGRHATIAATATAVPPYTLERDEVKTYIGKVFDLEERRLDAMMTARMRPPARDAGLACGMRRRFLPRCACCTDRKLGSVLIPGEADPAANLGGTARRHTVGLTLQLTVTPA